MLCVKIYFKKIKNTKVQYKWEPIETTKKITRELQATVRAGS